MNIGRRSRSMRVSNRNDPKISARSLMPDGERAGEVADVGEALDVVRAAPVAADRPLTVAEDLAGRHKPQSSVAEERRRRRSRLLGRVRGRGLGSRWILRDVLLRRSRLGGRRCGPQRAQRGETGYVAKRSGHQAVPPAVQQLIQYSTAEAVLEVNQRVSGERLAKGQSI